jgi:solute carrier family 25 phosphate transporter 23/24/25/41
VQPHSSRSSSSSSSSKAPRAAKPAASKGAYSGVLTGLKKMWVEEGFKGFMRGNGINCLRIIPYSAVQFSSYEVLKQVSGFPVGRG